MGKSCSAWCPGQPICMSGSAVSVVRSQSCLVLKCLKSYVIATDHVQSLVVNPLTDFVLCGMESGLGHDQNLRLNLS